MGVEQQDAGVDAAAAAQVSILLRRVLLLLAEQCIRVGHGKSDRATRSAWQERLCSWREGDCREGRSYETTLLSRPFDVAGWPVAGDGFLA